MLKKGFQLFGLILVAGSALISCEKCKECDYTEEITFQNIPALSGIPNNVFFQQTHLKPTNSGYTLGEVCGKNLDDYDNNTTVDTLLIYSFINNMGVNQQVVGGITKLTKREYTCK